MEDHYTRHASDDDETGYRLDMHRFVVGEYVSVRDAHGRSHTFKIEQKQIRSAWH
jgi:hypothetical protein